MQESLLYKYKYMLLCIGVIAINAYMAFCLVLGPSTGESLHQAGIKECHLENWKRKWKQKHRVFMPKIADAGLWRTYLDNSMSARARILIHPAPWKLFSRVHHSWTLAWYSRNRIYVLQVKKTLFFLKKCLTNYLLRGILLSERGNTLVKERNQKLWELSVIM